MTSIALHSTRQDQSAKPIGDSVPLLLSDQPIVINGPERPWIPDGIYSGILIGHATSRYRSSHKIEIKFKVEVQTPDGFFTEGLGIFFEIAEASPPLGQGGAFKPKGHRSKLAKLLTLCQEILETDKPLSIKDLSQLRWKVNVSTVMHDWDGYELPERSRYSVIRTVQPSDPRALEDWQ